MGEVKGMNAMKTIAALCLALALLASCTAEEVVPAPPGANLDLVAYDVPHGYGRQVTPIVRRMFFDMGQNPPGRVEPTPDGRMIVLAPAGLQAGIRRFLDSLAGRPPAPPPVGVRLEYWFVVGVPGPAVDVPAALGEVKDALAEVARTQGPMSFRLVERLELGTLADEEGHVEGRIARVNQEVAIAEGALVADLSLELRTSGIKTRVQLKPGQTLVLGEAGVDPAELERNGVPPLPTPSDGAVLLYVVRGTVRGPDGAAR
jgi:hypothetical protein